jgi:hypothetical protein
MEFKDFDIINEMKDAHNFAAIITSKRRTGKSVLMKDLCYKLFKAGWIEEAYVFSQTAHLQKDLFDYVPEENIIRGLDKERLKEIWKKQEEKVMNLERSGVKKNDIPCTLVLFDDVASDTKGCRYNDILEQFFMEGRHLRFSQIFIQQYIKCLSPKIRSNIDWFACFKINRADDRDTIVGSYIDLPKKEALEILKGITAKPDSYQCMIINLVVNSSDPKDYVRKYTASMKIPEFIFEPKDSGKPKYIKNIKNNVPEAKSFKWFV